MRLSKALALLPLLTLGGCFNLTADQRANLKIELDLAKQIGADVVSIWCSQSGTVYVVAQSIAAESRVTSALARNWKAAAAACPTIARVTGIQVVSPTDVPADATKGS